MFIGHFAVAFGAKRIAPRTSLGTLVMAAQWVDLLWPWFLVLGWERVRIAPGNTRYTPLDFESYPFTHSAVAAVFWALLLGGIYYALRKNARNAIVVGCVTASHWVLDWITHRPDLPLYPGGPKVGLGLWNSVPGTMVVESCLFLVGVVLYSRYTRATDRTGSIAWWSFVAFLTLIWVANSFGSPPPSAHAVAIAAAAMWLLVLWCYWIDRHRSTQS